MSDPEHLKSQLKTLPLGGMRHHLDTTLEQAAAKNRAVVTALNLLVDIEIEQRWQNAIVQRWRQSGRKEKLTIDQFNFDHQASRRHQKNRILKLLHRTSDSLEKMALQSTHEESGVRAACL